MANLHFQTVQLRFVLFQQHSNVTFVSISDLVYLKGGRSLTSTLKETYGFVDDDNGSENIIKKPLFLIVFELLFGL